MSNEDEFKRASLRGRGWKILRGTDRPTNEFTDEDEFPISSEEADDLLASGPPPLGMMYSPEAELSHIEEYEPDLLSIEQDVLELSEQFETKEWDAIPPVDLESDETELPVPTGFDESAELPPDIEAMLDDEVSVSIPADELTMEAPPAFDNNSFAGVLDEIDEWSEQPVEADVHVSPPSDFDENGFDLPLLDETIDTMEKTDDIEPPLIADVGEAVPAPEAAAGDVTIVSLEGHARAPRQAIEVLIPNTPERPSPITLSQPLRATAHRPGSEGVGPATRTTRTEAIPLVEDIDHPRTVNLSGSTRSSADVLIPTAPETPMDDTGSDMVGGSGGIYAEEEKQRPSDDYIVGPRAVKRVSSGELFDSPSTADPELLTRFVSDDRLNELWALIEQLQNEIVEQASGDRQRTDIYQQELLLASELLLESRENYDDARAVVYRVRADIKRDQRVSADIALYRPRLLYYILGWSVALIVLVFLSGAVDEAAADAPFLRAAYLPTIFGAAGGLFLAYSTLNKHTSVLRDFDALHVPWYLFCPLIGGVMGFLSFMLWVVGVSTTVTQDLTDPEAMDSWPVAVWLLAFYAGIQQNWVLARLRALRNNLGGGEQSSRQT